MSSGTDIPDDTLTATRRMINDGELTPEDLLKFIRTYVEDRYAVGHREMGRNDVASVGWVWGRIITKEMAALLVVSGKA